MKQLVMKRVNGWGGKRKNAGRKSRTGQRGHAKRPRVRLEHPVHITMRLKPLKVTLRSSEILAKFKRCSVRARDFGLHINHFALLGNHLHLIAEARGNEALVRGMRSFAGALGKCVRSFAKGRGAVFAGRFHLHVLKAPREYKHALKYVLLNHSRHAGLIAAPDDYSSGPKFRQWRYLLKNLGDTLLEDLDEYPLRDTAHLAPAQSWLGRVGWRKVAT